MGNQSTCWGVFVVASCTWLLANFSALAGNNQSTAAFFDAVVPSSPRAAKAYGVLKRHCARCHEGQNANLNGLGEGPSSILDFERLLREPGLVVPGMPDASSLYNVLVTRRMPPSRQNGSGGAHRAVSALEGPSARELEAVRAWIISLKKATENTTDICFENSTVDVAELGTEIERYVSGLSAKVARTTRFVSLAHVARSCVTKEELEVFRAGMAGLFNGLSWRSEIVHLEQVDPAGTVLAVDLEDLGWPANRWAKLSGYAGSSNHLNRELDVSTRRILFSETPVVRGDWFAHVLTRPQAYYALLGVPDTVTGLRNKLQGVYGRSGTVNVAGIRKSRVTFKTRLIARHAYGSDGFMWEAVDPMVKHDGSGERSLWMNNPGRVFDAMYSGLGADHEVIKRALGVRAANVRRFLFRLPNGHMGVMLADGDGDRINDDGSHGIAANVRGSTGFEIVDVANAGEVLSGRKGGVFGRGGNVAGVGCLGCHAEGAVWFVDETAKDQAAAPAQAHRSPFKMMRWKPHELGVAIANDQFSFAKALRHSAGKTFKERGGFDPVNALVRRYRGVLDLSRAASEMWLGKNELLSKLERYEGPLKGVARRLRQGVVSRDEYIDLRGIILPPVGSASREVSGRYVSGEIDAGVAPKVSTHNSGSMPAFWRLSLWSDKASYKVGDEGVIYAKSAKDCRLTLIGVDGEGVARILFPNGFERDNLISGGQTLAVPSGDAAYRLKFKTAGQEMVVGICAVASVDTLPGINHDFDLRPFTVLGNWRNHISETFALETKAFATGSTTRLRQRRHRRRGRRRRHKHRPKWLTLEQQPFIRAREALSINVTW